MINREMRKPIRKKQKRGFLIALLIEFEERKIHTWKVYSHSLREYKTLRMPRKWNYMDTKQIYNLLEDVVNLIRPIISEGLKSILLACEEKKEYTTIFLDHVNKHHRWLVKGYNRVSFGKVNGVADSLESAKNLISQEKSFAAIEETIAEEHSQLVRRLDKLINSGDPDGLLLYNLKDIEAIIYLGGKKDKSAAEQLDLVIITEKFIKNQKNKNIIYRLIQISTNKGIKTKMIAEDSPAVDRFDQLGGIIAFKKSK
jgi:stalled ribosome rescue protein Dom34